VVIGVAGNERDRGEGMTAIERVAEGLAAAALGVARGFGGGGTMWVVAPRYSAHGGHVAVEFVHPVIVGKRALPTVHVEDPDVVGAVRLLARPGDVVMGIGAADDRDVAAVMRRAEAWGLTTVWIGAGDRPAPGAAHHVLFVDDPSEFVLLYHVLWELTHVVFEHPGLLDQPAAGDECADDVCITCSDEGRLAEVTMPLDDAQALVLAGGQAETIDTTLVGELSVGDLVVVHAGTAITVLEEDR
jgi:hypothetical protein